MPVTTQDATQNAIGLTFAKPIIQGLLEIESKVISALGEDRAQKLLDLYVSYAEEFEKGFANATDSKK